MAARWHDEDREPIDKPKSSRRGLLWLLLGGGVGLALLATCIGTVVVLGMQGRGKRRPPAPPPVVQPPVAKPDPVNRLAEARWKRHVETDADFEIDLPGEPRTSTMSRRGHIFDPDGIRVRSVLFEDSDLELGMFAQKILDTDDRSLQQFYDEHQPVFPSAAVVGAVNPPGKIVAQTKVVVAGNIGREFVVQADGKKVLYRVFKGKKWAHVVFASSTRPEDARDVIDRFFASLVLLAPAAGDGAADTGKGRKIDEAWKQHVSSRDSFRVEMPGVHIPGIQKNAKGRPLFSITGKALRANAEFAVLPLVLNAGDPLTLEEFLDEYRDEVTKDLLKSYPEGKVSKGEEVQLDGKKGVGFVFRSSSFAFHCRMCRSANRVYVLCVQGSRLHEEDVDRFFQSFRLS